MVPLPSVWGLIAWLLSVLQVKKCAFTCGGGVIETETASCECDISRNGADASMLIGGLCKKVEAQSTICAPPSSTGVASSCASETTFCTQASPPPTPPPPPPCTGHTENTAVLHNIVTQFAGADFGCEDVTKGYKKNGNAMQQCEYEDGTFWQLCGDWQLL